MVKQLASNIKQGQGSTNPRQIDGAVVRKNVKEIYVRPILDYGACVWNVKSLFSTHE